MTHSDLYLFIKQIIEFVVDSFKNKRHLLDNLEYRNGEQSAITHDYLIKLYGDKKGKDDMIQFIKDRKFLHPDTSLYFIQGYNRKAKELGLSLI